MSLSLVVVFLYGSMIWGVLPIQPGISWEGHLFGAIAGIILAYYYRNDGPQRPKYSWELEEEELEDPWEEEIEYEEIEKPESEENAPRVVYTFKKKEE